MSTLLYGPLTIQDMALSKLDAGVASIAARQDALIEEFSFLDDWQERYSHIISLGRNLPPYPDAWRNDDHRVLGCQSQVWLHADFRDGLMHYQATSDALIVAGLAALYLRIYSGQPPQAICDSPPYFISALGFDAHLSVNRSNGLRALFAALRAHAAAHGISS